jgi:hypothetical protein
VRLLCVLQPCPESGEFREQQCAAYNEVPYEGELLAWTSHQDDSEPCALTCRGHPADEPVSQEDPIVVQLAPKVQDGTRCRPGSLDMCIDGKCQVSAVFCFACVLNLICHIYIYCPAFKPPIYPLITGTRWCIWVEALRCKPEGRGFLPPWRHWNFSLT